MTWCYVLTAHLCTWWSIIVLLSWKQGKYYDAPFHVCMCVSIKVWDPIDCAIVTRAPFAPCMPHHSCSHTSCIVAKAGLFGGLLWWVSSPILALPTAADSDWSVRRSPCSASQKWVGWDHLLMCVFKYYCLEFCTVASDDWSRGCYVIYSTYL